MSCTIEEDVFFVIKDYRKMVARRNRQIKKRKPKSYPPTVIKTRSMERGIDHQNEETVFEFE
jgi:hypothetical protein